MSVFTDLLNALLLSFLMFSQKVKPNGKARTKYQGARPKGFPCLMVSVATVISASKKKANSGIFRDLFKILKLLRGARQAQNRRRVPARAPRDGVTRRAGARAAPRQHG